MFGSLVRAYDESGLPRSPKYQFVDTNKRLLPIRKELFLLVEALAQAAGATTERALLPFTLVLNGEVRVRVEVAVMRRPRGCSPDWKLQHKLGIDFIVAGRLDGETGELLDYFLVPVSDMPTKIMYLREANLNRYSSWRYASLSEMFGGAPVGHQEPAC
jgi:hypothetical protein